MTAAVVPARTAEDVLEEIATEIRRLRAWEVENTVHGYLHPATHRPVLAALVDAIGEAIERHRVLGGRQ